MLGGVICITSGSDTYYVDTDNNHGGHVTTHQNRPALHGLNLGIHH